MVLVIISFGLPRTYSRCPFYSKESEMLKREFLKNSAKRALIVSAIGEFL